jgi:hypothetical protein
LQTKSALHLNYFQPSFKLKEKRREGAKVIKRYQPPATPYARALAHPKVPKAIKRWLRETNRTLDPVALLAEMRRSQEDLGNRIDARDIKVARRRPVQAASPVPAEIGDFARTLSTTPLDTAGVAGIEPRATHRKPKRRYKTRMRMPSKLDLHPATIADWLAAEPKITALTIVRRLAGIDPTTFVSGPRTTWAACVAFRLTVADRRATLSRRFQRCSTDIPRQQCLDVRSGSTNSDGGMSGLSA